MVKSQYTIPEDPSERKIDFDTAMPILMGCAAFATPAAVSLNWQISQFLSVVQFFAMKEKLKIFDGLDMDRLRQRDEELKIKMQNG